jgi:uncharacterized protein (TIGR00106 family)
MGKGTSSSMYIARGVNAIKNMMGIKYEVTPMGTLIESENLEKIFEASKKIIDAVHDTGTQRIETVLKIDSRYDKSYSLKEKLDSLKNHMTTI